MSLLLSFPLSRQDSGHLSLTVLRPLPSVSYAAHRRLPHHVKPLSEEPAPASAVWILLQPLGRCLCRVPVRQAPLAHSPQSQLSSKPSLSRAPEAGPPSLPLLLCAPCLWITHSHTDVLLSENYSKAVFGPCVFLFPGRWCRFLRTIIRLIGSLAPTAQNTERGLSDFVLNCNNS